METIVNSIKTVIRTFDFKKECIGLGIVILLTIPFALVIYACRIEIVPKIFNLIHTEDYKFQIYLIYLVVLFIILTALMHIYIITIEFVMEKYVEYIQNRQQKVIKEN